MKVKELIELLEPYKEYNVLQILLDEGCDEIYLSQQTEIRGYMPLCRSNIKIIDELGDKKEIT